MKSGQKATEHEIIVCPLPLNIHYLDDGTGVEEMLILHRAKWHKTCYVNMSNKTKVNTVLKSIVRARSYNMFHD